MPTKPEGVHPDGRGGWYLKVNIGRDPSSGRREQVTRRGFATAAEAGRFRRELLAKVDQGELRPIAAGMLIDGLLDLYLDGLDADGRLSEKTRFDYRHSAEDYVRPHMGKKRVRDVTPEVILAGKGSSPLTRTEVGGVLGTIGVLEAKTKHSGSIPMWLSHTSPRTKTMELCCQHPSPTNSGPGNTVVCATL